MSNQYHLASIDHDAKQLLKTVEQRILPTLEQVHRFQQSDQSRELTITEKEPIANMFVTTASQLDALWHHLRPEFDVQLIVPKDVPPPNAPPSMLLHVAHMLFYLKILRLMLSLQIYFSCD